MDLDRLDAEVGGPMRVRHLGHQHVLPAAADLPWKAVAYLAADPFEFGRRLFPTLEGMTVGKIRRVHAAWLAHNGLPDMASIRRLVYMVEKYGEGIEVDLRKHFDVSFGEMWRGRQWREILALIDHLPQDSHMNRMLTNDEEHMEQLLKQKKGDQSPRPSMADWSLTNSLLATLVDAVHKNIAVQQGIANPKGPRPHVDPYPRPATVAERIERKLQKKAHEEMVGMLLPKSG